MAMASEAARPDLEVKRRWLAEVQDAEGTLPLSKQRFAMGSMCPAHQTGLQAQLLDDVLGALGPMSRQGRDIYFLSAYTQSLLRPVCTEHGVAAMARALENPDRLHVSVVKFLREAHQTNGRCLTLRGSIAGGTKIQPKG